MEQLTQQALEFDKVKAYLAGLTISRFGAEHAEALSASTDRDLIETWLAEVSELKEIRGVHGHLPLSDIHDARELLARARVEGALLDTLELRQVYDILRTGRAVKKCMAELEETAYPRIRNKVEGIELVDEVERAIQRSIDEDGEVLDSASQTLKRIRKDLRQAREKIQNWLQNFLQKQDYQSVIQDQVVTLRQNRYVIPIKASSRGKVKGIVHDQSSSGLTVFIEPLETVELNNYIADLDNQEKQEIRRILLELTDLVRAHRFPIDTTMHLLGELDFINAKARLSEQWNCHAPQLRAQRGLTLRKARHPLLLLQYAQEPHKIVPIDLRFEQDYTTLLITGPNTGGKTVSLKTVGLLALMAQAGLHIPAAQDSELCVFEQIFADIGDQQSIEQSLSTFSSHISHIVEILKRVNGRSLVLLDELGAGTDPAEGASLGIAILEYLDQHNVTCLATTHHDALKSYAYTHPRTINACVEFDVNTLSPTYRLLIGIPGKSNAFIIAERLGLPGHLITRGKALMGDDQLRVDHLIQKLTTDSEELDRQKTELDAKYRGVMRLEKETDRLIAAAERERDAMLQKALEDAKQIVDQAIQRSQEVLRNLPAAAREEGRQRVKTLHKEATEVRKELHARQQKRQQRERSEASPSTPRHLAPGQKVRLTGADHVGTVLSLSKDGIQAEVQIGIMRVEVPINQLTLVRSGKTSPPEPKISFTDRTMINEQQRETPLELVLIGKRVEEALDEARKYLDDAFVSGLPSVSIVHGMGTGRLKNAVADMLRTDPHVVKFAVDERNYGMTNVELVRR